MEFMYLLIWMKQVQTKLPWSMFSKQCNEVGLYSVSNKVSIYVMMEYIEWNAKKEEGKQFLLGYCV